MGESDITSQSEIAILPHKSEAAICLRPQTLYVRYANVNTSPEGVSPVGESDIISQSEIAILPRKSEAAICLRSQTLYVRYANVIKRRRQT